MANVYYAICEAVYWGSPYWAGKGSEAARDAYYDGYYTSVASWESGRDGAAQAGDTEYGEIVGPWSSDDTTRVVFSGWDDTVTIILIALGDARHNGKWDGITAHRMVVSDSTAVFQPLESDMTFDGLQIVNTIAADSSARCFYFGSGGGMTGMEISNNILKVDGIGQPIESDDSALELNIWNSLLYATGSEASRGIEIDYSTTINIFNCVVKHFAVGIEQSSGTVTVKNCAVFDNTDDFSGTMTIDYCASDDGDGTNAQTPADWTDEFTDHVNHDYSLKVGNSIEDAGTDDPGSGLYSTDIQGTTYTANWPIGAFEEAAAGGIILPIFSENDIHSTIFGGQVIK